MDQDDIKFGCVKGGATERFFKNSKVGFYNKVWEKMVEMDEMTSNNEEVCKEPSSLLTVLNYRVSGYPKGVVRRLCLSD